MSVAKQLRVYSVKSGELDNWVDLFRRGTARLRRENGFDVQAWTSRSTNQFVWILDRAGSEEEFDAADKAYYALPEHAPLHEEALGYLQEGQSQTWFLEPVELAD
jgi:hypothetical protein